MAGFTNRAKKVIEGVLFHADALPTNYYVSLVSTTPTADTDTLSDLTEISGGGYSAYSLSKNTTDFDTGPTEDDSSDIAYIKIKDVAWTASGASIGPATYAVLTDDNATVGSRVIWAFWSLGGSREVSDGQTLTLQDLELRLTE
jgi:hypothetical protein